VPRLTESYIMVVISPDCPYCKSLMRWYKIQTIGRSPIVFVDVATLPPEMRMEVFGFTLTEYGLAVQYQIPRFVVFCRGQIVYNRNIPPANPLGYTEWEARAILMMLKSQLTLCTSKKSGKHVPEGGGDTEGAGGAEEEEGETEQRRRRRSSV